MCNRMLTKRGGRRRHDKKGKRKEVLGTSLLKDCMKKYEFNFFFCLGSFVGEKG